MLIEYLIFLSISNVPVALITILRKNLKTEKSHDIFVLLEKWISRQSFFFKKRSIISRSRNLMIRLSSCVINVSNLWSITLFFVDQFQFGRLRKSENSLKRWFDTFDTCFDLCFWKYLLLRQAFLVLITKSIFFRCLLNVLIDKVKILEF